MKIRLIKIAIILFAFNFLLMVLTYLLSWQATRQHPMKGHKVQSGDVELHVIDTGEPPERNQNAALASPSSENDANRTAQEEPLTIVLIHGASTSALDFTTNLLPRLARQWRVLAFDRPGHGYSDRGEEQQASDPAQQAAMIIDALKSMKVSNPVFIGHSWAGSVVLASLLAQPDFLKAGILISGATHPWQGGTAWHVELSTEPVIGDLFRWQYVSPLGRLMLPSAVEYVFNPDAVPAGYIDDTGLTLSLRPATYKNNAFDLTRLSAYLETQSVRYPDIQQPVLSIATSDDHVVPAWNHHDRLAQQVSNFHGEMIQNAGHASHHTHTEQVSTFIEDFLHSLENSSR